MGYSTYISLGACIPRLIYWALLFIALGLCVFPFLLSILHALHQKFNYFLSKTEVFEIERLIVMVVGGILVFLFIEEEERWGVEQMIDVR